MQLTFYDYIKISGEFDKEFAEKDFKFKGVDFWPVIRMQVLYYLCLINLNDSSCIRTLDEQPEKDWSTNITIKRKVIVFIKLKFYQLQCRYKLYPHKQLVASFDSASHRIKIPYTNEEINPFADSFEKFCDDPQRLYIESNNINSNTIEHFVKIFFQLGYNSIKGQIISETLLKRNLLAIAKFVQSKTDVSVNLYYHLLHIVLENEAYYTAYLKVLSNLKPRIAWSYNYANHKMMALNRACNKLNIPTVEYQHSIQSDYDYAYTYWPGDESKHSIFFPSYFWVWRESDRKRIEKNFVNIKKDINVILGGNLCVSQFLLNRKKNIDTSKKMLVALQGAWIPEFIENFIQENDQFYWYFRLHPRYPLDKEKLAAFAIKYPDRVEINEANEKSLYELFDMVDYLFTASSGSALEAQVFGVQNIIYSREGYDIYKEYIDNGAFYFVDNENAIVDIVRHNKKTHKSHDPVIANIKSVKSNLTFLLQNA